MRKPSANDDAIYGSKKKNLAFVAKNMFCNRREIKILQRAQLFKARANASLNWSIEVCHVDLKLILFIKISKHDVVGAAIFF